MELCNRSPVGTWPEEDVLRSPAASDLDAVTIQKLRGATQVTQALAPRILRNSCQNLISFCRICSLNLHPPLTSPIA